MKIALIGHPGSGKTHLAKRLGKKTKLQVVDIDTLFDKHPFYFILKSLYRKKLKEMFSEKTSWIVDGYHGKRMPNWIWKSADLIIFLDLPKDQLKKNILTRQLNTKQSGEFSHWQSTKANNIKNLGQIKFFDTSLRKNSQRIQKLARSSEFVVLKSTSEVQEFLDAYSAPK